MSELTCERCGKTYWPKQAWIHAKGSPSPSCKGGVNKRLLTAAAVVNTAGTVPHPNDRAAYMRDYMRKRRATKAA
jgi:uncharacterized OB-fold protein